MHIIESWLQSKQSPVPDHGGEDRLVVTGDFAAIIDGATGKTARKYLWRGNERTPGFIAADLMQETIPQLDAKQSALALCQALNQKIYDTYVTFGITDRMRDNPAERFEASVALYHAQRREVVFAGNCQAVIGENHYQTDKTVDVLNAQARADELQRLIANNELTDAQLRQMAVNDDPGRKLILNPPPGAKFPGLVGQGAHQNNPHSDWGFFALDGFADFSVHGFQIVSMPADVTRIVLASDGYPVAAHQNGVAVLSSLQQAEQTLAEILEQDPMGYTLNKCTKGKDNSLHSFDDRVYLSLAL